jgi:hypothetical protein
MTREELTKKISETSPKSAWRKRVKQCALDIIDSIKENDISRENILKRRAELVRICRRRLRPCLRLRHFRGAYHVKKQGAKR